MPTAHRGLPERAGPTGPTLPGPAVTLAATTAIQVMAALAALSVPAIAPAIAAATAQPASMVGTYISLVYLGSAAAADRKSTRLNSSHLVISYAVFCLKKKKN